MRGGGTGAESAAAGRAMPVVVLEQQKEATKQGSKEIKISGDRNKTRK